jgi:hypothetical protein
MKFFTDLSDGQKGERAIADYLIENAGWELHDFNTSEDKIKLRQFDISMWDTSKEFVLVEVKTDRWETFNYETNNIFIEFMCGGTWSGIKTTKSNKYIFYFPDYEEVFIVGTERLKEIIKTPGIVHHTQLEAGDGDKVKSYLIDRRKWHNLFEVHHVPKEYYLRYK